MPDTSLNKKITKGIIWKGLERVGTRGVTFLLAIILARLLEPGLFGIISMLLVFTEIAGVFVDSGFPLALVQKKNIDQLDCSTVFFANTAIAICTYLILFFCAKWVAVFYNDSGYITYLRVMALSIPFNSLIMVHDALLVRQLKFRLIFHGRLLGNIISGIIGCGMAVWGFGVWALIGQYVICSFIYTCCLIIWSGWKPSWEFSFRRLSGLFQYGWKIAVSFLLDAVYKDAYTLVIGKIYSKETLAFYKRGHSFPHLGISTISNTISSVFLPAFSSIQDSEKDIRQLAKQGIQTSMFFVTPLLVFLLVFADPIVRVLLTEKWIPCTVFLQCSCLIYILQPMNDINRQVILARGYSGRILCLEIILKVQLAIIILVTFRYGVMAMVWGLVVQAPIVFLETAWLNGKLAQYQWWKQLWDIFPLLCCNVIIAGGTYLIGLIIPYNILKLLIGGLIFSLSYLFITYYFDIMPLKVKHAILSRFKFT